MIFSKKNNNKVYSFSKGPRTNKDLSDQLELINDTCKVHLLSSHTSNASFVLFILAGADVSI